MIAPNTSTTASTITLPVQGQEIARRSVKTTESYDADGKLFERVIEETIDYLPPAKTLPQPWWQQPLVSYDGTINAAPAGTSGGVVNTELDYDYRIG